MLNRLQHAQMRLSLRCAAGPQPDHYPSKKKTRASNVPHRCPPSGLKAHKREIARGSRPHLTGPPTALILTATSAARATPATAPAPLHIQTSARGRGSDVVRTSRRTPRDSSEAEPIRGWSSAGADQSQTRSPCSQSRSSSQSSHNAPRRGSAWPDPAKCGMGRLPRPSSLS